MSIVCGTTACNAHCPFCVSKTTPNVNLPTSVNTRNLNIACRLAEKAGATTCLITGKGEPTLYPDMITDYILYVKNYFPFIELQTNGIELDNLNERGYIKYWYSIGLTTICLSAVSIDQYQNKEIYGEGYPLISPLARKLSDIGLTVRLSVMLCKKIQLAS